MLLRLLLKFSKHIEYQTGTVLAKQAAILKWNKTRFLCFSVLLFLIFLIIIIVS